MIGPTFVMHFIKHMHPYNNNKPLWNNLGRLEETLVNSSSKSCSLATKVIWKYSEISDCYEQTTSNTLETIYK